jgi:hypothetical protein
LYVCLEINGSRCLSRCDDVEADLQRRQREPYSRVSLFT